MPLKKNYRLDWWLCKDFQNSRQKNLFGNSSSKFFVATITKEEESIVSNIGTEPDTNRPIKMEVGIEECLHIEFEFNQISPQKLSKLGQNLSK
jgi:hypothetical protein